MLPPKKRKAVKRGRFDPRLRSPAHMNWVRTTFGCAVRGCQHVTDRIDPAHITGIGGATLGRKPPDDRVIPLCRTHHTEMDHMIGEQKFAQKYGIDLEEMIRDLIRESPILRKLNQAGEYEYPAQPTASAA